MHGPTPSSGAINASVHFNNWENLSKQDFTPVVPRLSKTCRRFSSALIVRECLKNCLARELPRV